MAEKLKHRVIKYDIIEHCNLNCRNCSHFSQFKTSPKERSINEMELDLKLLIEKIDMEQFHIFGGEPLLHSNIVRVMSIVRKIVGPDVEVRLLTNGLKILSMNESFFITAKLLNVVIELTEYPIKLDYKKIEEKITSHGIPIIIRITNEFWNFVDPTGKQDPEESFKQCSICPHTYYEDGRIWLCAYVKSIPFVNKHFGYNIEYDSISIDSSVEDLQKYLNHPCSTCRFCKASRQPEKWKLN